MLNDILCPRSQTGDPFSVRVNLLKTRPRPLDTLRQPWNLVGDGKAGLKNHTILMREKDIREFQRIKEV